MAARAYDLAAVALRGAEATLNGEPHESAQELALVLAGQVGRSGVARRAPERTEGWGVRRGVTGTSNHAAATTCR